FLDAFAGAGAVGLEALSRGAALVVLVDAAADAVAAMRTNASMLANTGGRVLIVRQDAQVALAAFADAQERFDVVYLDPPYQSDVYEASLEQAGRRGLLAEHGVVSRSTSTNAP